MDFDVATVAGWLIAVIGGVVAWLKTQDIKSLKSALSFLNPDDKQTTTTDENKYLADASWKMGEKQYAEILTGLPIAEQTAILSYVAAREAAGLQRYEIETSRGTYVIENGYIEDRPPAQVTAAAPTPHIIYSDGARIGHLAIKRLEQVTGVQATEIDPAINRIAVVGRPDNAGVIVIGVKVGDEEIQVKHMDAVTSDALNKDWPIHFRLWQYNKTVAGETVRIVFKQGYERLEDDGTTVIVWTEETNYTLPIKR